MVRETIQPELTRGEYLRLLSTARQLGKERTYLIIKVFGSLGLNPQELSALTVEALEGDDLRISGEKVYLPRCLRDEMISYARNAGVSSGPIFLTGNGTEVCRKQIWYEIRSIGRRAGVPDEKANSRQLHRLYLATQDKLRADIDRMAARVYDRFLEKEQRTIGWERRRS